MEEHIVTKVIKNTKDISTIYFTKKDGSVPIFDAGQYITVLFKDLLPPEGKAYSLSCRPGLPYLSITVKRVGKYSNRICDLKPGDKFLVSSSYGSLFEDYDQDITLIGAGVGIAPLFSIINDTLLKNPKRKVTLLYTNKTIKDICFLKELEELKEKHPNFKLILHVTREKDIKEKESTNENDKDNQVDSKFVKGRFNLEGYLKNKTLDATSDFILCGHINFVKDIYNDLLKCKVPVEQISTEIFFES
jgi:oxidoreductase FAD/NAD(P)-binding domain protein